MASKREILMNAVQAKFPKLRLRTSEEFDGNGDGVWVNGTEDGIKASDGFLLFNYYSQDSKQTRYVLGIHKELRKILEDHDWFGEWHDAGTCFFWEA